MKIHFKTSSIFEDILPKGSTDDEAMIEFDDGFTPVDVMKQLGLPLDEFYLVILNDAVVPKAQRETTVLSDGDVLGIFPPLKGG